MNISSDIVEQQQRRSEGCELAPCCLECPFPACVKEEIVEGKRWLKALRDASISELRRCDGASIGELGRQFHVSKRTVYRAIKENKNGKMENQIK